MKAIILAAGMGTRLGKYTTGLPKCMLPFSGKTLLERQVDILRSVGINDISIVTGYMAHKIKIPDVKYYKNEIFNETNMVESLFCAENEMTDDLLVCYSDIIYEKRIVLIAIESQDDIGVIVDKDYWNYWSARLDNPFEDIESLIIDRNGSIIELGNTYCSLEQAKIRYVGILKFSVKGLLDLKNIYYENKIKYYNSDQQWLRSKSFKNAYMTCLLQALINSGHRVEPIYVSHGWFEFDTVRDYELALQWDKEGTLKRFISLNA